MNGLNQDMKTRLLVIKFSIILISVLFGCKKKEIQIVETSQTCDCPTFPEGQNNNVELQEVLDTIINLHSQYNPSDNNEIMFITIENNSNKLYRYNLLNQNKQLVKEFTKILSFDWGINDWILLELGDKNIWRMKSNGDSLEQVSAGRPYFHPKWNYDCSKIMAYMYIPQEKSQIEILSSQGELMDSIINGTMNDFCMYGSWKNSNELIIGSLGNEVKVIDPINKQIILSKLFPEEITEVVWLNSNEIIANAPYGLYKMNINTQDISKLRCQCPVISYQKPNAKTDGSGLTITKMTYDQIGTSIYVNVKSEIIEVLSNGSNEKTINLP